MNGNVNVDVNVKLKDRIPNPAVLNDLFGQIKSKLGDFQIPGLPLSDISKLSAAFNISLPDASKWSGVIPPDVSELLKKFPDAQSLSKPLLGPLKEIRTAFSVDFSAERKRIEDAVRLLSDPSHDSPEEFLASLFEICSQTIDSVKDSFPIQLLGSIQKLLGKSDMQGGPEAFVSFFKQVLSFLEDRVGSLVLSILSISSLGTIASRTEQAVKIIPGLFSKADADLQFKAVLNAFGEGNTSFAAQISGLDWNDSVSVDAVRARLKLTTDAFGQFTSGLVRGLAFTEASVTFLDLDTLQQRAAKIQQTITKLDTSQLKALAETVNQALGNFKASLSMDSELNIDKYKALIGEGFSQVQTALEGLDPAKFQGIVQDFVGIVTLPLKKFEEFKDDLEAIVRDALKFVQDGIQKIDLSPLRNSFDQAMGELEKKLKELDQIFQKVKQALQDAFQTAKTSLSAARDFILDPENGLKKKLQDAFQEVIQIFESLNLQGMIDGISQSLDVISQGLVKIEFTPVVDTSVQIMDTITDVLKTIAPLLATDALREKLNEATEFLRQLDFQAISDALVSAFDEILQGIDSDAFAKYKVEFGVVLDKVNELDPAPALESLQSEVFDPLIAELEKIKPAEILKPVQEGFDKALQAVAGFDPTKNLRFLEEFFQKLIDGLHEISPVKLLAPVEEALADLRKMVEKFLRIDDLNAFLKKVQDLIQPWIEKVDFHQVLDRLEDAFLMFRQLLETLDTSRIFSIPAAALREFFAKTGIILNSEGLRLLIAWLRKKSTGLGETFGSLQKVLEDAASQISFLDLKGYLTPLREKHAALKAAFHFQGEMGPVQLQFAADLDVLDPMKALAPLISKVDRVKSALSGTAQRFADVVRSVSTVFASADQLVQTLASLVVAPLDLLREITTEPLRSLFPGHSFSSVKELLLFFVDQMNPAQWKQQMEKLAQTIQSKLKAVFSDLIFGPIQEVAHSLQEAINSLSIESLKKAIESVFAETEAVIQQFNPAPLLQEIRDTYQRISGMLQGLDPGPFITEIETLYTQDIVGIVKAVSPRELLLPLLNDLFGKIKGFIISFDIEVLFKPVLDHLRSLRDQLVAGLAKAGTSYKGMLDAIPTGPASVSASASISVSTG